MCPELSEVAHYCHVGIINAHMEACARRRSHQETVDLRTYMAAAEFEERAARLEPRVRAGITRGVPVPLKDIAAELELPPDLAVEWLAKLGIDPIIAIGGRGFA